jgi:hypothetical protein
MKGREIPQPTKQLPRCKKHKRFTDTQKKTLQVLRRRACSKGDVCLYALTTTTKKGKNIERVNKENPLTIVSKVKVGKLHGRS